MRHHHKTLAMSLMAALSVSAVQAQDLTRTLIDQGKYWQSRGDAQRAAEVWRKLLKLNPNLPEALGGMAVAEAEQQRYEQANSYLAKLKSSNPNHPALASAEESINLIRNNGQLKNARDLARSGKADEAVAKYQSSIGTSAPKGQMALEYYQTLGGSSQGWEKARAGLEQLAREQPNDAAVQLALGQHLTYREATRREGINILAKIAGNPNVGAAATDSWKKALVWTSGRSAYQSLYKDYLRLYPNDAEVRERLNELEQQIRTSRAGDAAANDPVRKRSQTALDLLEAGQTDKAQAELQAILQERPEDSDALGGMGIVRMREENFVAARDFLKRAIKNSNSNRWKPALDSATYWALINEAASARTNGNHEMALQKLQQAIKLNPQDVTAENDLASTLTDMSQLDAAEAAYRRVLARQAENPDALRGLVNVLSQNNKAEEALKIVDGMSANQQERIGAMGALRATQALGKAKAAAARGDDAAARAALDQALVNDPSSPWVRLEMARQYLKMGARNEARGIMDGLLDANPYESEALYAHALLASEMQDWSGALATLDKIAVARRTNDVAKLYKRVWVHVQADAASTLASEGRNKEALSKLQNAEPFVSDDPELQGKLALTYADLGENTRAVAAIRQLLAKSTKPDVNLRLQYAAVLFKTRQNAELAGVLRQVQAMPMTAQQRQGYEDLRVGYTLRQIEALREAGELSTAYETLAPILAERPNDPTAVGALARLYAANNNPAQGLALYNQLLERDPNNLALLLQAATLATSAKEYSYAESALQVALAREPQNPEVLTAIGRLYRAQGKNTKATEFFTAAVTYEKQMRDAQLAAAGVQTQAKALNPFTNRSEQLPKLPTGIALDKNLPGPLPANSALGQLNALFTNGSRTEPSALTALPPLPAASEGAVSTWVNPNASAPRGKPTPANYLPATYQPAPLALDRNASAEEEAPRAKRSKKPQGADITKASTTVDKDKLNPVKPIQRATNPPDLATPLVTQPTSSLSSPSQSRALAAPAQSLPVSQLDDEQALPSTALSLDRPGGSGLVQFAPIDNPPMSSDARISPRFDLPARNLVIAQREAPAPRMESQPAPNRPRTAMDDLNELQQNRIPTLSMGAVVRSREGESGLGQLTDVQTPVSLRFDTGESKVSVNVTPTSLFSGTPDSTTATRFGAGPEQSVNNPNLSPGSQSASGVGVGVVYENDKLKADIGTTPIGFLKTDTMGGLKYRFGVTDNTNLMVDVSRRPVTDSLLSFAGVKDARTGDIWGAVASTGGRFDLSWDNGSFGLYTYGSAHSLTGSNVANNTRLEGGGGMYWKMDTGPNASFKTGVNITGLGFDKNLRYFTYGQGGYFSPQRFFSVSVPVEWSQRSNKFSYQLKGSLGLQTFTEDASPYFPTDPARQANGAAAVAAGAGTVPGITANGAYYNGQSVSGLGYAFGGAMEYQIHPQLYVGGSLSLDNAKDYKQLVGSMYLRYFLDPYSGLPNLPPLSVKSPYAN